MMADSDSEIKQQYFRLAEEPTIACKIYEYSSNIAHIFPPRFHRPDLPTGLQALLPHADQLHVRLGEAEHPGDVCLHGMRVVKSD